MQTIYHEEYVADRVMMEAVRSLISTMPREEMGPAARPGLEASLARIPVAEDVAYEEGTVGGVNGWWCRPRVAASVAQSGAAMLYLHGGAYVLGSASGYRGLVGQLVSRCGVAAFIADYSLAPERPFPRGLEDAEAAYAGLVEAGARRIVLAGDSAGGGLALALLSRLLAGAEQRPVGVALLSPWTDLTLSGESMETRAAVDPMLSRERLQAAVKLYMDGQDEGQPLASPLFAEFGGAPAVLIEVGEDEVLLDDAMRLAERLERQGVAVELHVWKGMIHVFPGNVALLQAAREALDQVSRFVRRHLG